MLKQINWYRNSSAVMKVSFNIRSINKVKQINTVSVHRLVRCMTDTPLMPQVCWKCSDVLLLQANVTGQITSTVDFDGGLSNATSLPTRALYVIYRWYCRPRQHIHVALDQGVRKKPHGVRMIVIPLFRVVALHHLHKDVRPNYGVYAS
jgi:hypothetical protein